MRLKSIKKRLNCLNSNYSLNIRLLVIKKWKKKEILDWKMNLIIRQILALYFENHYIILFNKNKTI